MKICSYMCHMDGGKFEFNKVLLAGSSFSGIPPIVIYVLTSSSSSYVSYRRLEVITLLRAALKISFELLNLKLFSTLLFP